MYVIGHRQRPCLIRCVKGHRLHIIVLCIALLRRLTLSYGNLLRKGIEIRFFESCARVHIYVKVPVEQPVVARQHFLCCLWVL